MGEESRPTNGWELLMLIRRKGWLTETNDFSSTPNLHSALTGDKQHQWTACGMRGDDSKEQWHGGACNRRKKTELELDKSCLWKRRNDLERKMHNQCYCTKEKMPHTTQDTGVFTRSEYKCAPEIWAFKGSATHEGNSRGTGTITVQQLAEKRLVFKHQLHIPEQW